LRPTGLVVACITLLAYGLARADDGATGGTVIQGTTKPFSHNRPGVNIYGTVLKLPVKEGQVVKEGDLLLQQDDRQERAELEKLQLEADSNVRVEAADADLKIKQIQLKRFQELQARGNASASEVEEAQSKAIGADATAKVARLDSEKAKRDAKKQSFKVEQMTIKSPVNGRVEAIEVAVGDVCDPQKPVMTVVQNDPLKVEFYLPVSQASKLKMGQTLAVRYPNEDKWTEAAVDFKSPFADAASDTQKIGLLMKNPEGRDSGMQVQVRLPADIGPAASAR